jgi:glycerophosphoryl diester phosphodiesterase
VTGSTGRALRLAHRGDWRRAPENTLPALLAALEVRGCDGVEFDVRTSSDGVPVLQHDETLARVHGRPERPQDLTVEELRACGVSVLEDVLAAMPVRAFLDIEVKDGPAASLVGIVEAYRGEGLRNAVASSFVPAVLRRVREQRPAWPLWLNTMDLEPGMVALARKLGCVGISVEWHSIDERSVRCARAEGLDVATWTIRRRPTFDRLARLGVMAMCVEGAALDGQGRGRG